MTVMIKKGINSNVTGRFFFKKYIVKIININAASIWFEAPKIGQSSQAAWVLNPVFGSSRLQRDKNNAGNTEHIVDIKRLFKNLICVELPISIKMNL